jgi:predicted ATPase
MTSPMPQKRTGGRVQLNKDGSNIAEYLLEIRRTDTSVFDGILETMQYVLPYARDLQPTLTSELERNVYLQITEGDFKVPSWLLSTGTLRFLAILSILRHPEPPPLILIEEIENGLDPRTVHLIVSEIQNIVESGKSQIVVTTHSPYLLDLLSLSHIVLVERNENNEPVFSRPADQDSLKDWSRRFTPGKLYTMERLSSKGNK